MSREPDPEFERWADKARGADIMEVAGRLGARLKRFGRDHKGACPVCSPGDKASDRFVVTPSQPDHNKRWMCRGAAGGDIIAMVQHVQSCDFMGAVQFITGEAPPKGGSGKPAPDPEIMRERRQERIDARVDAAATEKKEAARKIETARDLWDFARDIQGTRGISYFARRGINLPAELSNNIRFAASLDYYGFASEDADRRELLGHFPCIVSAMRLASGDLVACHRTYLDPKEPKKLSPPGDQARNSAKQVMGKAGGAMIIFGELRPCSAIGEGIETTLSWRTLGGGPEDCGFAAAYSLGNIAGSATGQLPHPSDGRRKIPNGEPDMDKPGIILPDYVEEVILLGDGDSDPAMTRANMLVAARRFRNLGKTVSLSMSPHGGDWNDVLMERENLV